MFLRHSRVKGHLIHNRNTGLYNILGLRAFSFRKIYERASIVIQLARPILQNLALIPCELASIYVADAVKRLCLSREEEIPVHHWELKRILVGSLCSHHNCPKDGDNNEFV